MQSFEGRIAVVTGGGTGMGRELARQLAAEGCHVAICDVSEENMAETRALCRGDRAVRHAGHARTARRLGRGAGAAFRDDVCAITRPIACTSSSTTRASAAAAASSPMIARVGQDLRRLLVWRLLRHARLPADARGRGGGAPGEHEQGERVLGDARAGCPHTAYSAAKFAVKGFSEALINDLRMNAPHDGARS